MTLKTVFFLTTFLGLTATACDSGDGATATDGGSSGTDAGTTVGETEAATTASTMTTAATTGETATVTSAGTQSTGSETATSTTDTSGGSDSSGAGSESGSDSGSDGSTGASTDAELCESTGGTWDELACGDYVCGEPNLCEALIPGCDCGDSMNFREEQGCQKDPACEAKPVTFACGDEVACTVDAEYCEVFFPGVMMASIMYACRDMPDACEDDPTCDCLEGQLGLGLAATCNEDFVTGGETIQIFAP